MNLRAVPLLLALSVGLLCAPSWGGAQVRLQGAGGFSRNLGSAFGPSNYPRANAGRPASARPAFAAPSFGAAAYGGQGYGRGYNPPRAYGRDAYSRPPAGYAREPFGGAYPPPPYGQTPYGQPVYPARPYAPAYPAPSYGAPNFGGNWRQEQNEVRQAVREGRHIPLGQAIEAVRRRSPGRELDADLVQGADGRSTYRLRWAASDGRRIDYLVDAATGAIVGVQGAR